MSESRSGTILGFVVFGFIFGWLASEEWSRVQRRQLELQEEIWRVGRRLAEAEENAVPEPEAE